MDNIPIICRTGLWHEQTTAATLNHKNGVHISFYWTEMPQITHTDTIFTYSYLDKTRLNQPGEAINQKPKTPLKPNWSDQAKAGLNMFFQQQFK